MGCDIHFYVEKRVAGQWVAVDKFKREEPEEGETHGRLYVEYGTGFYSGRNYDLFAILADVRNGRGFAGIKTGEGFNPIASPRGIPEDASTEYKTIADDYGRDGHSHSHMTVRDLMDFDWTQTTTLQGWVDAPTWAKWSRYDRHHDAGPRSYCGGISGQNVKHVTPEEMDELLLPVASIYTSEREKFAENIKDTYALASWHVTYADAVGSFFTRTLPKLLALAGGTSGIDDVRIVFFFDN